MCVSNGENFTFRVRGRVVTGLRLARGSSACNAAVNALHRSYAKDFVRQVGQQSRVLFDFRQCNVRVDISGEKCTFVRTGAVCFVNMCSSGSMAPQCQEFGPKAGGANIVVRPQLCAGMPNVGETFFRRPQQEAALDRCERGESSEIGWGRGVFFPDWISRQRVAVAIRHPWRCE